MVRKTEKFRVNGEGTIKAVLTANDSCVEIANPFQEGVDGEVLEFEVTYQDEDCFGVVLTLSLQDNNCTQELTFAPASPCASLEGTISHSPTQGTPHRFALGIGGGIPPYTVDWGYDLLYFRPADPNPELVLQLNAIAPVPATTEITATITDSQGCTEDAVLVYSGCKPFLFVPSVNMTCAVNGTAVRPNVRLNTEPCSGRAIDWSTLQLNLPQGTTATNNGDGTIDLVSTAPSASYQATATVKDDQGVVSDTAVFNIIVPSCESGGVTVPEEVMVLEPGTAPADEIIIPIKSFGKAIDYDTFSFKAATGQTLNAPDDLTTTNGEAILLCASESIKYTVDMQNENVDLIQFEADDIDGNPINLAKIYIDYENFEVPAAVDGSFDLDINQPLVLDLKANDTGPIDPASYRVTTAAVKTSLTVNPDGTATATGLSEGSDSFGYRFDSPDGQASNEATVTLNIRSAGQGGRNSVCPGTLNLNDYLIGDVTSGGTWSASLKNPTSPSIANPASVDFSGAKGTYVFTYTVGGSSANVILIFPNTLANITSVSTPTNNAIAGAIQSTVSFEARGAGSAGNISIVVDGPSTVDSYPPDSWNGFTGSVLVEYQDGTGAYDIILTVTDTCGNSESETVSINV